VTRERERRLASLTGVDRGEGTSSTQGDTFAGTDTETPTRRPDRVFKRIALVSAACLVGFIVFVVARGPTHPAQVGSSALEAAPPSLLAPGTAAPAFSLPNLQGGDTVSLSAFRGKPVVVNFFASWCRDCRAELAAVATVARESTGRVGVLGVDSNDTSEAAADRLLSAADATYPVGVDAHATVATQYLVQALPVTYFLNATGHVVGAALGPQTVHSLERWVARLEARR
jgi:cytochrome c biogenesis protein CcmG, thiol:disulfide interchange protein DsbE